MTAVKLKHSANKNKLEVRNTAALDILRPKAFQYFDQNIGGESSSQTPAMPT